MIDLHRLPDDFPSPEGPLSPRPVERARQLEAAFAADVARSRSDLRFVPNLVVHEFEALLFSSVHAIQAAFPRTNRKGDLDGIVSAFATPEEIDDRPELAPSKRLASLFPEYEKVLHGPTIARAIGIDAIRAKCPKFDAWVTRIGLP